MLKKPVTINMAGGLEVRPLAMLVQVASQYKCETYIESGNKHVNAKSIMGMMTLGLDQGDEVIVTTDGQDEQEAIVSIEKYLSAR